MTNKTQPTHTVQPWFYNQFTYRVWADTHHDLKYKDSDAIICNMSVQTVQPDEAHANARRIIACVNACKNVPNEWLQENAVYALIEERDRLHGIALRAQEAASDTSKLLYELLKALESIADMKPLTHAGIDRCFDLARKTAIDAIAKAKGANHD
jgi:hypothetical protein